MNTIYNVLLYIDDLSNRIKMYNKHLGCTYMMTTIFSICPSACDSVIINNLKIEYENLNRRDEQRTRRDNSIVGIICQVSIQPGIKSTIYASVHRRFLEFTLVKI